MRTRLLACVLSAFLLVACGGAEDPDTSGSETTVTSGGEAPVLDLEMPLARLMSGNVVVAAQVDVAHLRVSSLYPRAVEMLRNAQNEGGDPDFAIALADRTETFGFAGGIDDAGPDPHLTVFRGQYEQSDFERLAALRPDAVAGNHAGQSVFVAGGESLTMIGGRLIILGTTALVNEAIDRLAERAPTPSGVATRLLDDASLSSAPIAIALVAFDDLRQSITQSSGAPRELRSLVGGSAVINLAAGISATILADVGSEQAASGLRDRLRGELSSPAVRIGLSALGLSGVTSGVQITASGTTTQLQVTFDEATLGRVVSALESLFEQFVEEAGEGG